MRHPQYLQVSNRRRRRHWNTRKAQSQRHDQSVIFVSLGLSISVDSLSLLSCFAHKGLVGDALFVLSEFLNTIERQTTFAHLIQPHPHPRYKKPIHYPIQMYRGDSFSYKFSPVPQPYMQTFEKEPVKLELTL